jgi:hypothetical protein
VWDKDHSSICNPDTGDSRIPYRRLSTPYEATISAKMLNERWEDRLAWEIEADRRHKEDIRRYLEAREMELGIR